MEECPAEVVIKEYKGRWFSTAGVCFGVSFLLPAAALYLFVGFYPPPIELIGVCLFMILGGVFVAYYAWSVAKLCIRLTDKELILLWPSKVERVVWNDIVKLTRTMNLYGIEFLFIKTKSGKRLVVPDGIDHREALLSEIQARSSIKTKWGL